MRHASDPAQPAVRPLVIGHQGCDGIRPGNTLAAFRQAIALGADLVECDVHLTRDDRLAIIHDTHVDRTTNGHGAVREMTMAELAELDAGGGEPVPELDALLALASGRVQLAVELKAPGTAAPAVAAVRARAMESAVTFISFQLSLLAEVRELAPQTPTGALFNRATPTMVAEALAVGATLLDVQFQTVTGDVLLEARRASLGLWVWTPDKLSDLTRMADLGVDGITTNRPDRLRALLRDRYPATSP